MFETSCVYIYILLDRGRRGRERKKKKETPSFGLHSLDLHNSQALRKTETINGESSIIMKTTPGSRYPLFHNHNKYYTPPLLPCWKACSSRRTPRAASSRTGRAISLSLSLFIIQRKKEQSRKSSHSCHRKSRESARWSRPNTAVHETAFYSPCSFPTISSPRFDNRSFKLALHASNKPADRISKRVL